MENLYTEISRFQIQHQNNKAMRGQQGNALLSYKQLRTLEMG